MHIILVLTVDWWTATIGILMCANVGVCVGGLCRRFGALSISLAVCVPVQNWSIYFLKHYSHTLYDTRALDFAINWKQLKPLLILLLNSRGFPHHFWLCVYSICVFTSRLGSVQGRVRNKKRNSIQPARVRSQNTTHPEFRTYTHHLDLYVCVERCKLNTNYYNRTKNNLTNCCEIFNIVSKYMIFWINVHTSWTHTCR